MTAHIGETTYTCDLCDYSHYDAEDVKGYKDTGLTIPENAEVHICEDCFKVIKASEWEIKGD